MCFGIIFGAITPELAKQSKIIIDSFIHIIKIIVGPIIFLTVVSGVIGMNNLKQLGRIGIKSLIYFEVVSTIALIIGFSFGYIFKPGNGMHLNIAQMDSKLVANYIEQGNNGIVTLKQLALTAIPYHPISAFINGKTLQILVMSLGFGLILSYTRGKYRLKIIQMVNSSQNFLFKLLLAIMWLSPIAGFAAMAFLIGKFGIAIILPMMGLIITILFRFSFWMILGSILGEVVGDFFSAVVVPKSKVKLHGKFSGLIIFLTHLISSFLVVSIAYIITNISEGYTWSEIFKLIMGTMVIKISIAIIMLPIAKIIIYKIKLAEGLDVYDNTNQNYSLFRFNPDFNKLRMVNFKGVYSVKKNFDN